MGHRPAAAAQRRDPADRRRRAGRKLDQPRPLVGNAALAAHPDRQRLGPHAPHRPASVRPEHPLRRHGRGRRVEDLRRPERHHLECRPALDLDHLRHRLAVGGRLRARSEQSRHALPRPGRPLRRADAGLLHFARRRRDLAGSGDAHRQRRPPRYLRARDRRRSVRHRRGAGGHQRRPLPPDRRRTVDVQGPRRRVGLLERRLGGGLTLARDLLQLGVSLHRQRRLLRRFEHEPADFAARPHDARCGPLRLGQSRRRVRLSAGGERGRQRPARRLPLAERRRRLGEPGHGCSRHRARHRRLLRRLGALYAAHQLDAGPARPRRDPRPGLVQPGHPRRPARSQQGLRRRQPRDGAQRRRRRKLAGADRLAAQLAALLELLGAALRPCRLAHHGGQLVAEGAAAILRSHAQPDGDHRPRRNALLLRRHRRRNLPLQRRVYRAARRHLDRHRASLRGAARARSGDAPCL